jgi:hypothetical protein
MGEKIAEAGIVDPGASRSTYWVEAHVKYLLLIYLDESYEKRSLAERQQIYREHRELSDELTTSGKYLGGHPLQPPTTAASVRVREGKRLVTDGPFTETREHLGGYKLVDVKDIDEAIDIAARCAVARVGRVEVRPVREGPPT